MTSIEERERRARWLARQAYQRTLDAALTPNPFFARIVDNAWEPMLQFLKEGPDVGEPEEVESAGGQRFN